MKFYSIKTIKTMLGKSGLREFDIKIKSKNIRKNIVDRLPAELEIINASDGETIQLVDRTIRTVTEIIDETSFTDNIQIKVFKLNLDLV